MGAPALTSQNSAVVYHLPFSEIALSVGRWCRCVAAVIMKQLSDINAQQLLRMLGDALQKEAVGWQPHMYNAEGSKQEEISAEQRDGAVSWLAHVSHKLEFQLETLALGTALLDKFLLTVKARPKYLQCISIACLYLAAKMLEEDNVIPGTPELLEKSCCERSVSEVLRMERVILDKFSWDLRITTPLDFLNIFYALLLYNVPRLLNGCTTLTPQQHLQLLSCKLQLSLARHPVLTFRPSTLALAVLSLELEMFRSDWLSITIILQRIAHISSDSLIHCRETIAHVMMSDMQRHRPVAMVIVPAVTAAPKSAKRKVDDTDDDIYDGIKRKVDDTDDDIYDGIKRLYSEDITEQVTVVVAMIKCGSQVRQDTKAPTPLQAVAN
ncbi:Cyclin-I [Lamellibrachia satsuma]|nr:Cyclin-I [Lamellibrachia satsuma]